MIDFTDAKKIATMLAAVAEPTRMAVLHQLGQGPRNVGQLAQAVGIPIVNMSHHLGVMRNAGLLDHEKDGRRVIYSLRPDVFAPSEASDVLGTLTFGSFRVTIQRDPFANGARAGGRKKPAE